MLDLKRITKHLKKDIENMLYVSGTGGLLQSYFILPLLVCLYFGEFIEFGEDRDYFITSRGDIAPALYTVLGEIGLFPKEEYYNYSEAFGILQKYVSSNVPGVEISTGFIEKGYEFGVGVACGTTRKVYCLVGIEELMDEDLDILFIKENQINNLNIFVEIPDDQLLINFLQEKFADIFNIIFIEDDVDALYKSLKETLKTNKPVLGVLVNINKKI